MLRKFLCFLAASLWLAGALPAGAVSTSAASAILMDAASGRVLYAHNADQPRLIASTTKIMTAVVALERGDLARVYTVTDADMAEGSSMYLQTGEEVTLETLLYGLMLVSGNDAALAVAHCVCGDVETFVAAMNEKARDLGMTRSSFANPNGLDHENHYSTARDMAVLTQYALQNETFRRIVSTRSITLAGRTLVNHNKLLRYYEDCVGVKTGFTKAAGRTLVSAATRDGQTLIAVTLNDGSDWADHRALFDYGFANYPARTLLAAGDEAGEIPLLCGAEPLAALRAAGDLTWPLGAGERAEIRLEIPRALTPPVPAGTEVGFAVLVVSGREAARVPVVLGGNALLADSIWREAPASFLSRD